MSVTCLSSWWDLVFLHLHLQAKHHPVQEKTTLWVHPLKNDNMGAKKCA